MNNLEFPVEHSYDGVNWEARGVLNVRSTLNVRKQAGNASLKTTKFEKDKLDKNGFYYLRIKSNDRYAQALVPSCQLIASDLQEKIVLFIDSDGSLLHFNLNGTTRGCRMTTTAYKPKTTIDIGTQTEAHNIVFPVPKTEADKVAEPGFFRKYWYVFLLIGWMYITKVAGGAQPGGAAAS